MWFTRVITKQDNHKDEKIQKDVYDKWQTISSAQTTAAIAKELEGMRKKNTTDETNNYQQINNRGELMNRSQKIHTRKITKKGIERTKQILENRVCIVCSYEALTIPLLREHKMQCHSY